MTHRLPIIIGCGIAAVGAAVSWLMWRDGSADALTVARVGLMTAGAAALLFVPGWIARRARHPAEPAIWALCALTIMGVWIHVMAICWPIALVWSLATDRRRV